jgi:hypothetical protein
MNSNTAQCRSVAVALSWHCAAQIAVHLVVLLLIKFTRHREADVAMSDMVTYVIWIQHLDKVLIPI